MKKILFYLLLSLLLPGCAAQAPEAEILTPGPAPAPVSLQESETAASWILQSQDLGNLQLHTLNQPVTEIMPAGNNLILLSGQNLALLDTQVREITAFHDTLTQEPVPARMPSGGIAYHNGTETVILDQQLCKIRCIPSPEEITGAPLLSRDGRSLFYCTSTAIRVLDLDSGISRVLKEAAYSSQRVSGLLLEDSVLQISITDNAHSQRTLFLSTQTGQLLQEYEGNLTVKTGTDRYWAALPEGAVPTYVVGSTGNTPLTFQPRWADASCFFLPDSFRAVTVSSDNGEICLNLYDLTSGIRTAEASVSFSGVAEMACETEGGTVWLLCREADTRFLLRWDADESAVSDGTSYLELYYTRDNPDYDGLAACSLKAGELSEKYGIEILIYRDAVALEPWDYHLEYEYRAGVLQRELEALDHRLGMFPEGFLQTLAGKYTALKICIVRSAEGSPESGSPEAVNGIQFLDGFDAYIVLSTAYNTEYALYHELCHLMETVIMTESTAYDRWDMLNPPLFQYDAAYANETRDDSQWLQTGKEYFIDAYAMRYAKEDRARLFEYAMTEGHENLFRSPNLQQKLRQLCTGIREAFALDPADGPFLWEQYLEN